MSRDHYHEDGYLVPSPRYEVCFSASRPIFSTFCIPRKCYFRANFAVCPLIFDLHCNLKVFFLINDHKNMHFVQCERVN